MTTGNPINKFPITQKYVRYRQSLYRYLKYNSNHFMYNILSDLALNMVRKWYRYQDSMMRRGKHLRGRTIPRERGLLRDRVKIITSEQCAQLINGKLPTKYRISTGLYLAQDSDGRFIACDYSIPETRVRIEESEGFPRRFVYLPKDGDGWVEDFDNPLDAIDYLLGVDPDDLKELV